MDRRHFLSSAAALGLAAGAAPLTLAAAPRRAEPFQLRYAPHFGMFRHHAGEDLLDQLRFMADEGFSALEDNGMAGRPVAVQEAIARTISIPRIEETRPTVVSARGKKRSGLSASPPSAAAPIMVAAMAMAAICDPQ